MKAKEWWKNKDNAKEWLKKCEYWKEQTKGNSKHFRDEENLLVDEISKTMRFGSKILEVGAGDGRIIGKLSLLVMDEDIPLYLCSSIDINADLSKYISEKYPIKTYVGEITDLPFEDNQFDLVYTHEVLQHISPEEIERACSELKRVGKEIWCLENWRSNEENGIMVSGSHSGRWNYNLKKHFESYYDFYTDWGQLFIKARKKR
jgi:ubiquinone/menaquinone biosynthesis C-methylase UbiE